MTKEALKLALEALELHGKQYPHMVKGYCLDAITAIKEALAQPEQEPVAWVDERVVAWLANRIGKPSAHITTKLSAVKSIERPTPVYTTPPQRKPLTEQEIGAILEDINAFGTRLYTFARAVEAAHGIKGEA